MELTGGRHLAYCTNIHRGESWAEIFGALKEHTLEVRRRVCPPETRYAIGLRLSARAAAELEADDALFSEFRSWLDRENCYVFTINGFPYGAFHAVRVKEQVFRPDWTTEDRLDYTKRLFRLLVRMEPPGEGSVSTLPASHKTFQLTPSGIALTKKHVTQLGLFLADLSAKSHLDLHVGFEPEPLGLFESTPETIDYLEDVLSGSREEAELRKRIGVNFDTCHLALQYEDTAASLLALADRNLRVSKVHLSSALRLPVSVESLETLSRFEEGVYLHQVLARRPDGGITRYPDLPPALENGGAGEEEWRVHFHVPLHASPGGVLGDTRDQTLSVLDLLSERPDLCAHLEMETYTWEVLPPELRAATVVDQLVQEYQWCLEEWRKRGVSLR